jgi:tetratricopeptide (TPR) repeat protein
MRMGSRVSEKSHPDSIDLYFRGVAAFNKGDRAQARIYFERAAELDPGNVDALVGVARVDAVLGFAFAGEERAAGLAAAETPLLAALSLAPGNVWAHLWLGLIQVMTNRAARGIAELEQALRLNSNLAVAHAWLGLAKMTIGRAAETEAHVNEALRISPGEYTTLVWKNISGSAKLHLGADEKAVARLRRAIETNRNFPPPHFLAAAALAHLGKRDWARSEAQVGLKLDPKVTIRHFRASAESDNPTYLAQRERVIEGLRIAGVPKERAS